MQQLVQTILQEDLLYELARSIRHLPFEARKDTQTVFSHILRYRSPRDHSQDPPAISYIVSERPEILVELCHGYNNNLSAMPCGTIIREALRFEAVAAVVLCNEVGEDGRALRIHDIQVESPQSGDGLFWNFFQWINEGSFEVSADAFTTFRVSILRCLRKDFPCRRVEANRYFV